MLHRFLLAFFTITYCFANHTFAGVGDTVGDIKGTLRESTFIDPACIAPAFGYKKKADFQACSLATTGAIIGGAAIAGVGGAIVAGAAEGAGEGVATGCGQDVTQSGENTNTPKSLAKKKIKDPTYIELKVKIYGNLLKLVTQNIKATKGSEVCPNPIKTTGCTITTYQMPDGTAITDDNLYKYVIYSSLYDYISADILEANRLEAVRAVFKEGYSDADSRTFEARMKALINGGRITLTAGKQADGLKVQMFIGSGLNSQTSDNLAGLIDSAASEIAKTMISDALFFQKLGYSSYARFPVTSRLVECLDGTFANLFLRDLKTLPLTPYKAVQLYFQPIVILVIILYAIAQGYSIMMAHGIKDKNEIIMFFIEIALVFYFAIGDAWKDFFFGFLKSFVATIGGIIVNALPGSADGCSVYKSSMYPFGKGNLALFDAVDCKLMNYLGLPENGFLPGVFWIIVIPMIIPVPLIGWLIGFLGVMYTSAICYTILIGIQTYIVGIVSLSLLLFLSPIVVPMVLFKLTKDIFDKWVSKIIGTVIQMSMATLMIVITFAILDSVIYGAKPEENLFEKRDPVSAIGTPQANKIKDDCYGNEWWRSLALGIGNDTSKGILGGFTPPACTLYKYTKEGVQWIGFPIHGFLWFFSIPFNFKLDYMLAFVLPCIVTLLSLGIVDMLIKPLQTLIDQISGQDSQDVFGANKFSVTAKAMEGVQQAIAASKAATDGGGSNNKQQAPDPTPTKSYSGSGDKSASKDPRGTTDTAKNATDATDTAKNATDATDTAKNATDAAADAATNATDAADAVGTAANAVT